MRYRMNRTVDAIQFTGIDSIPAIQVFMAPNSPCYNAQAKYVRLAIDEPNPEEDARWPGQGPHFKLAFLQEGDWIIKDASGTFTMMTNKQFERDCTAVPTQVHDSIMAPLEHLDVAAEIAAGVALGAAAGMVATGAPQDPDNRGRTRAPHIEELNAEVLGADAELRDPDPTIPVDATAAQASPAAAVLRSDDDVERAKGTT